MKVSLTCEVYFQHHILRSGCLSDQQGAEIGTGNGSVHQVSTIPSADLLCLLLVVGHDPCPAQGALAGARLQLPHAARAEAAVAARPQDGVGRVVDADGARRLLPAAVPSQLRGD